MSQPTQQQVEALLTRMQGVHVVVVGDVMLDEYLWGEATRISPEAPVQVVEVNRTSQALGGAANVARNLLTLGGKATLVGVVGQDTAGDDLCGLLREAGLTDSGIVRSADRPTVQKTRLLSGNQQVVRYDRERRDALTDGETRQLLLAAEAALDGASAILISDYAKGVVTGMVCQHLVALARRRKLPLLVDPKGSDLNKYRGASLMTPNLKELADLFGQPARDDEQVAEAATTLRTDASLGAVLVTRGERGMTLLDDEGLRHIPSRAREVYDVTGAGDTVLAGVGLAVATGASLDDAAALGNAAAGVVVGRMGAAAITPLEVIQHVREQTTASEDKVVSQERLLEIVHHLKNEGKQIVFTNGCFDLLHVGHVRYLQRARALGSVLILALNTDASVTRLKGPTRPVVPERERAYVLSALSCIDYVTSFDDDTPLALIEALMPDILVKGGDYTPEQVVGKELVEAHGGRVEIVSYQPGKSTTEMISRMSQQAP